MSPAKVVKLQRAEPRREGEPGAELVAAIVVAVTKSPDRREPELELEMGSGRRVSASRAKSCLVAPEPDDRVLVGVVGESVYVLAVLEGRADQATRLSADAGLTLESANGRVTVCSGEGIDLRGGRSIEVTTESLRVTASEGAVAIDDVGFFGKILSAHAAKVRVVAQELDHVLGRFTQRADRAYRFVAELDQLRAGSIDVRAENLASIRAENTVVTARALAKIDGEQVHIG